MELTHDELEELKSRCSEAEQQLAATRAEAEKLRQDHASVENLLLQSRRAAVAVAEEHAASRRELIDRYGDALGRKHAGELMEEIAKLSELQEGFAHIQACLTQEVHRERAQNAELVQTVTFLRDHLEAANALTAEQERRLSAVDAELRQLRLDFRALQGSHDATAERLAEASSDLEEEKAQRSLLHSAAVHEQELRAASELSVTRLLSQIDEMKATHRKSTEPLVSELDQLRAEHDQDKGFMESELAVLRQQLHEEARSAEVARFAHSEVERQLANARAEAEHWRHEFQLSESKTRELQARAEEASAEDEQLRIDLKHELQHVKELLRSTDGEHSEVTKLQRELNDLQTKHRQELADMNTARTHTERELEQELERLKRRCSDEGRSAAAARLACSDAEQQLAATRTDAEELRQDCARLKAEAELITVFTSEGTKAPSNSQIAQFSRANAEPLRTPRGLGQRAVANADQTDPMRRSELIESATQLDLAPAVKAGYNRRSPITPPSTNCQAVEPDEATAFSVGPMQGTSTDK